MTETNTKPISPNLSAKEGPITAPIPLPYEVGTNTPKSRVRNSFMSFDAMPQLEELARDQGILQVADFDALLANSWSDDEGVEDFLAAREQRRREGSDSDS
jgi:hypothetical protein